jgi:DNA-binding CsgD family transcriptional regulator
MLIADSRTTHRLGLKRPTMQDKVKHVLSERQAEIARLVADGKTSREIGFALSIDSRTVDSHIEKIFDKLDVRSRAAMVAALFGRSAGDNGAGGGHGRASNLPSERTPLFGRESEIADIVYLLQDRRIVTVTGAGGVGKTRTVLGVGGALIKRTQAEVRLVELAPLAQGALVATAVAQALNVRESASSKSCRFSPPVASRSGCRANNSIACPRSRCRTRKMRSG